MIILVEERLKLTYKHKSGGPAFITVEEVRYIAGDLSFIVRYMSAYLM